MKHYQHIFFDLDHTLWDFERNSSVVLNYLMDEHHIEIKCNTNRESFLSKYSEVNVGLWKEYREGKISKEQLRSSRFFRTMKHFGYENKELGMILETEYIARSPYQTNLIANANEVLDYLSRKYKLHIITNGFREGQFIKLDKSGISSYFDQVVISEVVGFNKPDPRIFESALSLSGAFSHESIMIGDDLHADVLGALNSGLDAVYFNPKKQSHEIALEYEISDLNELLNIL